MRELITRSISGIVYVSLVVLSALFSRDVFIILFCTFAFICLLELMPMIRLRQWFIYPILPIAYYFLVWKSVSMEFLYLLLIATLLVNIYLIRDLVLVDRIALFNTKKHIIALLYLIGSSLFLALIPDVVAKTNFVQDSFQEELIIGIFVIIWTNDSFAYPLVRTLESTNS
jgi:phosphatidate cytidylyltransferase